MEQRTRAVLANDADNRHTAMANALHQQRANTQGWGWGREWGWGHSRRLSAAPLDNVAAIVSTTGTLGVRAPESQRLEKSEPLLG